MYFDVRVIERSVRLDLRMIFILSITVRVTNGENKNQGLGKMPYINKNGLWGILMKRILDIRRLLSFARGSREMNESNKEPHDVKPPLNDFVCYCNLG